ncbi:hypothetical protein H312_03400, partial [Anncaliia algerae PRA339]
QRKITNQRQYSFKFFATNACCKSSCIFFIKFNKNSASVLLLAIYCNEIYHSFIYLIKLPKTPKFTGFNKFFSLIIGITLLVIFYRQNSSYLFH